MNAAKIAIVLDNSKYLDIALEKALSLGAQEVHCLVLSISENELFVSREAVKYPDDVEVNITSLSVESVEQEVSLADKFISQLQVDLVLIHRPLLQSKTAELPFIQGVLKEVDGINVLLFGHNRWSAKPKILATLDVMDSSDTQNRLDIDVLVESRALATVLGGSMHALSVISMSKVNKELEVIPVEDLLRSKGDEVMQSLKQELEDAGCQDNVKPYVEAGVPAEVIPTVAKTLNSAVVVVGFTGRKGLIGWLMGNTAESILSNISTDTLLVRARK